METLNRLPNALKKYRLTEVVLFNSEINYTHVLFANGKRLTIPRPLKNFVNHLANHTHFFRPHQSFLINMNYVKEYEVHKNDAVVEMKNGIRVNVARRRKTAFEQWLKSNYATF